MCQTPKAKGCCMQISAVRIPEALRAPTLQGEVFDLDIQGDRIRKITPSAKGSEARGTVIPALADVHVHLDKTYTIEATGPANGDLFKAIEIMAAHKAHWTSADLRSRMGRGLEEAWLSGTRALRTHIDWMEMERPIALDVLLELQRAWSDRLTIQWVSLSSLDQFADPSFCALTGQQVKDAQGILGCFIYRNEDLEAKLDAVFAVAKAHDLDLDFHVDEGLELEARGLAAVAEATLRHGWQGRVNCGHVCSLSVQPDQEALQTLARVAEAGITLTTLPVCNLYLQGEWNRTPIARGMTRVLEARAAGVRVCLGNDNVADAFMPYGGYELLEAWAMGIQIGHLAPPQDWLDLVTTSPARLMGLAWDGVFHEGCPADFIWLPASSGSSLVTPAGRRGKVCRAGRWLKAES